MEILRERQVQVVGEVQGSLRGGSGGLVQGVAGVRIIYEIRIEVGIGEAVLEITLSLHFLQVKLKFIRKLKKSKYLSFLN